MTGAAERSAAAGALSQWVGIAREAEFVAQRSTKTVSLELLQAARRTALGTSVVEEMVAEQDRQRRVLRAAALACNSTLERVGTQLAELRKIEHAARSTAAGLADTLEHADPRAVQNGAREELAAARAEAEAVAEDTARTVQDLEQAERTARAALDAAQRAEKRQAEHEAALTELRARFGELGGQASDALGLLTNAGKELDATATVYEVARLSVLDLQRERLTAVPGTPLPPPSGVRLAGPAVFSTDGAIT